jgi:hypothetical protein
MPEPGAHPHSRFSVEDPIPDSLGDLVPIVGGEDQGIEVEPVVAHQSRNEGAGRGPDDDIGLVRVPSGRELDCHEGRHFIGGAGDSTAT